MALTRGPRARCLGAALAGAIAAAALPQEHAVAQRGGDTTRQAASPDLVPAGFGTLRRDDVAIVVQVQGLTARTIPLDEAVIRTLAPDSYRALQSLRDSRGAAVERIRARTGLASVQPWYVEFFNVQQGEARFEPRGMLVRSAGRDFRPLEVIPLVPGYEDGRLAQGRSVNAILVFDPAIALTQPLTVTLAGQQSSAWGEVLPRLERERAAIRSRALAPRPPASHGGAD